MSGQHIGRRNLLLAAAASVAVPGRAAWSQAEPPIHVVKGRGCECCDAWVDYLREQGFTVTDEAYYRCRECGHEWLHETGSYGMGWVK